MASVPKRISERIVAGIKKYQPILAAAKARIRAKVEHPFHVVKNLFKQRKARYRGMAKNAAQLLTLFGLANLMLAKRRLMVFHAQGAS